MDVLVSALESREARGLDYVELRAEESVNTALDVRETGVQAVSQRLECGHSVRVLRDGRWGFAVSSGSSRLKETIASAAGIAKGISALRDERVVLAEVKPLRKTFELKPKVPIGSVPVNTKTGFLRDLCSYVSAADSRINACTASYRDSVGVKCLVTSDGTRIQTPISQLYLMTTASAKDDSVLASARDELGLSSSGWEYMEKVEHVGAIGDRVLGKVRKQLEGTACKRGSFPCVLGPRVVGMLAHEALGHLSEADYFTSGAFVGREGLAVAPDQVTLVDSPQMDDGFGNVQVDDEGVVPRKVKLIDRGILCDQMTNREWAARLGARPTGNARAESYRVPPIIRMRNTYFELGDQALEELIEPIKFGYYCLDVRGGQAESNSSFQVGIQECYEIRNGEISGPTRDFAISGIATKSLTLIDGLGKDFGFESSYCGKMNQSAATSDGGPHMSLKKGAIIFGGSG